MVRPNDRSPEDYTQQNYLEYLEHWGRHFPPADRKNIAIIGAGMSGLTCGWLLSRAGHSVKLF